MTLQLAECTSVADQSWAAVPRGPSTCEPRVRVGDAETEVSQANLGMLSTQAGEVPVAAGVMWPDRPSRPGNDFGFSGRTPEVAWGRLRRARYRAQPRGGRQANPRLIMPMTRSAARDFCWRPRSPAGLSTRGSCRSIAWAPTTDGRPYYAMRFIRGDSLKEVDRRFHADPELKADAGRRSLQLRKLLRRFTDVCNAIDYAHNSGVLHRDIKPGNIIVGKLRRDAGRRLGARQAAWARSTRRCHRENEALVVSEAVGSTETLPGSTLGTPAYMSPEQAAGRSRAPRALERRLQLWAPHSLAC